MLCIFIKNNGNLYATLNLFQFYLKIQTTKKYLKLLLETKSIQLEKYKIIKHFKTNKIFK